MKRVLVALRLALAFLTIIPVPGDPEPPSSTDLASARYAFPVIGLLIGLVLAALSAGLDRLSAPPLLAAFLLVAAGVAITGGLHLDGLADTADGLFLPGDSERRLAVMRDPHVGTFGVVALLLSVVGKVATLATLHGRPRALALVTAAIVSRALILVVAGAGRYPRAVGTGKVIVESTTPTDALGAGILTCVVGLAIAGRSGLAAGLIGNMLAIGLTALALRRIGGITGDILGAFVELVELCILVVLAMFQSIQPV
jgi:adenosylcobinamide-GDP ribazoletransferase